MLGRILTVAPNEIKILKKFKTKYTAGNDDFISLLKTCIDSVDNVVTYIMNNS